MSRRAKILLGFGLYFAIVIAFALIFGSSGKNDSFEPQNEFKLENWVPIQLGPLDLSITKAVLYLVLASALTIAVMVWIARRMQQKPNRVQTAV
ncbi:MAG: F0F1 ATP synthase subunit A, partial [Solirubrobacterales bacterium]